MEDQTLQTAITAENYKEAMRISRKIHNDLNPEAKKRNNDNKRQWDKKRREDPEYKAKLRERALNYYHNNAEYRERQKEKAKAKYYEMKDLIKKAQNLDIQQQSP